MDYEKEYEEYTETGISRGRLIAKKCIKYALRGLVAGIIALLLWRVFFSGRVPKSMKMLIVTDSLHEAYEECGEDLLLYTQKYDPVNMEDTTAGYFWVSDTVFIPAANQVQVVIRYNNSTLKHIAEDFSLKEDESPTREDEVLDVTLAIAVDPDPTNKTTADREIIRIHASEVVSDTTSMYNYRRLVFDDIPEGITNIINISVDFYYVGSINYDATPYGTIIIYRPSGMDVTTVDLSSRDQKALESYVPAK